MKKLNRSFLKKFNAILVALLAVFGFANCQVRLEYGTPEPAFAIKGQVTNIEAGTPVQGIRVAIPSNFGFMYGPLMPDFNHNLPPAFSDRKGNFLKFVRDTIGGVPLGFWDESNSFYYKRIRVRFEGGKRIATVNVALTPKAEE